jgi:hypothetical protein
MGLITALAQWGFLGILGFLSFVVLYQAAWALRQCFSYYRCYRACVKLYEVTPIWSEVWQTLAVIAWVECRAGIGAQRMYAVGIYDGQCNLVATYYPAVSWSGRPILDPAHTRW